MATGHQKILRVAQERIRDALKVYENIREAEVWAALGRELRKADGDGIEFRMYHSAKTIPGDFLKNIFTYIRSLKSPTIL